VIVINGHGGELKVGYQVCVRLNRWQLSGDTLIANDVDVDPYWIEQPGPRHLRLPMKSTTWMWRDVNASVGGNTLVVRVSGAPDQR
jgi:hypothetical protein